jgi:long-chain acyl-CoA synthetase
VHIVEVHTDTGLPAHVRSLSTTPLPDPDEGMPLVYSSGTTGRPKGVKPQFPTGVLGNNPSPQVAMLTALLGLDTNSVYLSPAPLYHAAPLGYVLTVGQIGATAVIMHSFDAAEFLRQVAQYRVTHTQVVPTMFARLLALPQPVRDTADMTSLKCVIHAAAPCPASVKRAMFDWLGPIIHEYYSGSERFGFTYCSPEDWLRHPGSVGKSLGGDIHILDENGIEVELGEEGLIYFESPPSVEYLADPEKTRSAFNDNGWGTFGDVGRLDADGFLYISDRRTDLIISGGVNVYPRETEEVLTTHPAVRDAAVVGVPDADLGQRVTAVVSLADGWSESRELARKLIGYCRNELSHIKCPKQVLFSKELPRTETGKLLRRVVRDSVRSVPSAS